MKKILYSIMMIAFAAFTFTSCEDVPAPYEIPSDSDNDNPTEEVQPSGSGTLADPYNVAAIIQEAEKLASGESSTQDYYFKGKVKSIKEQYSSTYGNGTFYITDENSSNSFYVYRAMYLGNKKFTDGNTEIAEGDEVIICGKITNYSGTLETVQNGAYLYSLNGKTSSDGGSDTPDTPSGDATGDGTLSNPYNCVAANQFASSLAANAVSENAVYIKGKIVSFKNNENYNTTGDYGNATFYISDDGTSTNQFLVFRALYLNNEKYTSGDVPQVGDDVIIYGNVTNYYGNTPETAQGKSYLYQWTKNSSGGGDTGGDDTPSTNDGVSISGTTLTLTNSSVTAGTESITIDLSTIGKADAESVETVTLEDGTTIVFDANGEQNGPKYYAKTNGVRVYKNNTITFNGKSAIAKVVMECDSYSGTDYVGNETATISASGNCLVYTNVFTGTSGGGVQLRVQKITITYAK